MNITNYVCETLCINASELLAFAKTSPYRYKQYQIAKRNSSEKRTIAHPAKELKFIQKVILTKFTDELPIHPSAFAYRKGLGIRENALQHINNKYLLKLDFKNFFPSITPIMFFDTLKKFGLYNQSDEEMLTGILFWRPERKGNLHLSIAPSGRIVVTT